ncbi:hypothetical protein SESBI_21446 [Sesbania bispinosa]|nr:hypothetical protein SESBI_21446 [Sesbania bispinosa]
MSSLTEEQLIQMVRDFIESESDSLPTPNSLCQNHIPSPRCLTLTLQEILWETTDIEVEVLQQILKHSRNVKLSVDHANANNLKKLVVMKLKLDGYEASLCRTSWDSSLGRCKCKGRLLDPSTTLFFNSAFLILFRGDYEYVEVMVGETRLIVDMDFRSQFELAKPTREYKELTDTLPRVFVGTEPKLTKIISLLCSAAKESLKEKGFHVPPWRKLSYMQSKWLSKNCKKISFTSNLELGLAEMNI